MTPGSDALAGSKSGRVVILGLEPIGHVRGGRAVPVDDQWGGATARIVLCDELDPEALQGLEEFPHAEIIFFFDRVAPEKIVRGTPVLDIKPVMQEFLPRGALRQPAWSHELMRRYWNPVA